MSTRSKKEPAVSLCMKVGALILLVSFLLFSTSTGLYVTGLILAVWSAFVVESNDGMTWFAIVLFALSAIAFFAGWRVKD